MIQLDFQGGRWPIYGWCFPSLQVGIRNIFGSIRYVPLNATAKLFFKAAGRKSMGKDQLKTLKKMGWSIDILLDESEKE